MCVHACVGLNVCVKGLGIKKKEHKSVGLILENFILMSQCVCVCVCVRVW